VKAASVIKFGVSIAAMAWTQGVLAQTSVQGTAPAQVEGATPIAPPAQDPAAAGVVTDAADIVVTATRRSQSLQDVPLSVNVATGEQLEKLSILDTKDIGRLAPGLELTNNSGRSNAITLRGIGFDPDQGTGPAVQTYLNEVPTGAQTLFTALYDIGQIEVLRGAQGLLRGLSAPAGAITITTRRPEFDRVNGYAQLTATDRNAYNAQFGVNLPFSDTFAIRVAGLVDGNRLNQVKNVVNGDHSNSDSQSARITLGWRPSDRFTAYLTYQYLEQDNRQYQQAVGPGNAPSLVPFGDPTRSGPALSANDYGAVTEGPARFQMQTHTVNLNARYDLGGADLTVVGGYQASQLKQVRDVDTGNSIPGYMTLSTQSTPIYVATGDVRLASKDEGVFGWSVGAFYQQQRGTTLVGQQSDNFFTNAPAALGLFLPISTQIRVPAKGETYSFNANGRFKFGTLTFEGGLRYTIEKSTRVVDIFASSPGFAGGFGIPTIAPFSFNSQGVPDNLKFLNNKPLTGGATLTWEPSPRFTAYASYGRSFRSGSVGIGSPAGLSDDLTASRNEKTDSFEVGAKGTAFNRRLSYAIAGFYQKFDGFLSRFGGVSYNCRDFFGSCNAAGAPVNNVTDNPPTNGQADFNYNGNATIKGVEVTLDAHPTSFWDLGINAAYAKARYDKGSLAPCNDYAGLGVPNAIGTPRITGTGNVSFCRYNRLADTPDFSLTATTEIRIPTNGTIQPFGRGLLSYRPAVYGERVGFELPSRELIDLFLGLRTDNGRWEVSVFAKNLLNQKRIINSTVGNANIQAGASTYDSGYRLVQFTNPREFGLTTAFRF
jgi:iron complex outermembrane receptor protein